MRVAARMLVAAVLGLALFAAGCGSGDDKKDPPKPTPNAEAEPEKAEFSYSGATGPARWASLAPANAACGEGREQSPIDIVHPVRGRSPELTLSYQRPGSLRSENNGHSVEFFPPAGNRIRLGDHTYRLIQFHYHAPSEHRIAGKGGPMEVHFVHLGPRGIAVIGFLLQGGGPPSAAWDAVSKALPAREGGKGEAGGPIDVNALLPKGADVSYRYRGSLTTPPCTEGVSWVVLREPVRLADPVLARFTDVYDHTARPLQPLNGRRIVETSGG